MSSSGSGTRMRASRRHSAAPTAANALANRKLGTLRSAKGRNRSTTEIVIITPAAYESASAMVRSEGTSVQYTTSPPTPVAEPASAESSTGRSMSRSAMACCTRARAARRGRRWAGGGRRAAGG
jgi:hypothetical protein